MLEIRVLGELAVLRDGQPLRLPQSRKTRALLGFLALSGRPLRRDRLVEMFWAVPDDPRGALRWSLSKLREVVDEADRRRLIADRDQVGLDVEGVRIDLAAMRQAEEAGPEAVAEALAGFAGDVLHGLDLPDCHDFQAWLIATRAEGQALQRRLLVALRDQAELALDDRVDYARRLVEREPLEPEPRLALMRLLGEAGRRREAEEQYKLGSRLLDAAGLPGAAALRKAWLDLRPFQPAPAASAPAEATPGATALLSRPAIAVLPFENMSGDPEQDYFAEGISDDLITSLSQWRWFPVIARASSFACRGRTGDVSALGRELGARYVLQGSVRRAGERLRVTAQLVDAAANVQIWAQRYDRALGDVFALQDELTTAIVAQIAPELMRVERQRAERKPTGDLTAWDLNLRALAQINRGTREGFREAEAILAQSLARLPGSSHTLALLAYCRYQHSLLAWTDDPIDFSQRVLDAAQAAVQADDQNWLAHALHGISTLWHHKDYDTAILSESRAIDLNPTGAIAHQFQGCVLAFAGEPRTAIEHLDVAIRLNPQSLATSLLHADKALAHLLLEEHEEAVAEARRAVAQFPGDTRATQRMIAALGHLNRQDEARAALADLATRQSRLSRRYLEATYPFRMERHFEHLVEGLKKAGWNGP